MANEPVKDTDPTLGKLVMDAQRDISSLISKEIQLAKSELKVSVKHGGVGHRPLRRSGVPRPARDHHAVGRVRLLPPLERRRPRPALGFLVVFVVYVLIAALLAYIGLRQVKQVKAPERAIEQGRQIPQALKGRP